MYDHSDYVVHELLGEVDDILFEIRDGDGDTDELVDRAHEINDRIRENLY